MNILRCLATLIFAMMMSALLYAQPHQINLMPDAGFEGNVQSGWTAMDSCRIVSYRLAWHSGKRSLAFYPLRDGAGIACDVSTLLHPGYRYFFSGWFRNAEAGWGQVDVLLNYQQAGQSRQVVIGRADCDKDSWKNLANEFAIPEQAETTGLRLIVKTAWGRIAFLTDDLELRPALQVRVNRPDPERTPDVFIEIGPSFAKRNRLQARVRIFDGHQKAIAQFSQPLHAPYKPVLPDGYYRVTAHTEDLDGRAFQTEKILYIGPAQQLTRELDNRVDAILSGVTLSRYHGWMKYLRYMVSYYQQRDGDQGERTLQATFRLSQWASSIEDNPALFDTLKGVQEWAYLSHVDDSGQPFKLAIPAGYDSGKSYPLVVVMHGYGGNHMEYSGGVQSNSDFFELHILGRARGGGYSDLSEADVLDAVDYVRDNWRIDERRIHLTGASMGGGGTFKMASRFPDRWASGRPVCGYGADQPIGNSLHVPLYSTHSQDDPTVPVLLSRAPLQNLMARGGQVVLDETIGLQHAAWNYHEGNNRALKWMYDQVRPEINQVRHIDFSAWDRYSCAAYWLKIAEWGRMPGPARFQAVAGLDNQLYLQLKNIHTLLILTKHSPLHAQQAVKISVNGQVPFSVAAPLPDSIFISAADSGWTVSRRMENSPAFTLHTPGGVHNLYNREPLLIVYGTAGDAVARTALANAAIAASKSIHPNWVGDEGDIKDGVASHQLLYGHLKMKPDTAVSESDLKKYNLLLIGKAGENRLVQKMQDKLPVQFGEDILCSDGLRLPGKASVVGLYFFNPLAPEKLIYWVAADDPAAYRPYNILLQLQVDNPCGLDLLVVQDSPVRIIKTRHFDSRWNWVTDFEKTTKIPAADNSFGHWYARLAESMRTATGSDYALQAVQAPSELAAGCTGITQWADWAALDMTTPIALMQLTGSTIQSYQQGIADAKVPFYFYPAVDEKIDPEKIYQIAMAPTFYQLEQLIHLNNQVPDSFRLLDMTVFEAMQKTLF